MYIVVGMIKSAEMLGFSRVLRWLCGEGGSLGFMFGRVLEFSVMIILLFIG